MPLDSRVLLQDEIREFQTDARVRGELSLYLERSISKHLPEALSKGFVVDPWF